MVLVVLAVVFVLVVGVVCGLDHCLGIRACTKKPTR